MSAPSWTSLHVYLHGGLDHTDRFLVECLAPGADQLDTDGGADGWFFMRYWTGGPHVRVRLRDATDEGIAALTARIEAWLAENPLDSPGPTRDEFYARRGDADSHGWFEHGTIVPAVYEPEVERYGGDAAMPCAEKLFVESTRVALAAIRGSLAGPRRLGVAFNLFTTFARAVCENDVAEVAMLRRYVYSARYNLAEAPDIDVIRLREQAEREFAADPARYRSTAAQVHAVIADGTKSGYLGYWSRCAASYAAELRSLELTGYVSAWTVLLSQLHMLMNRIGVTLSEEYHLSWLASLVSAGATIGDGYHDRGMATSARRYHEESKYFVQRLERQLPRPAGPDPAATRSWPGADLALPAPDDRPLDRPSLVDALAHRRSMLAKYHGPVSASDLSSLLLHGAGERLLPLELPDLPAIELAARPYPSAGGLHASKVLVLPVDVPGIPPAVYSYVADGHLLRSVAPAPDLDRLAASSPYFDPAAAVSMDAHSVPLWLFVAGDIRLITERYGLRGYRFLLLEAGHLAQNLVLMSTALGYRSATIGAFYDDVLSQLLDLDGVGSAPFYAIPVGHG